MITVLCRIVLRCFQLHIGLNGDALILPYLSLANTELRSESNILRLFLVLQILRVLIPAVMKLAAITLTGIS